MPSSDRSTAARRLLRVAVALSCLLGAGGVVAAAGRRVSPIRVQLTVHADSGTLTATLRFVNRSRAPQYLDKHMACLDGQMRSRVLMMYRGRTELPYLLPMGKYPAPGPDDYVPLAPGASLEATVRLDTAYELAPGRHRYRVRYDAFHGRPDSDALLQLTSNDADVWYTR
jgi:hypothetical protein